MSIDDKRYISLEDIERERYIYIGCNVCTTEFALQADELAEFLQFCQLSCTECGSPVQVDVQSLFNHS